MSATEDRERRIEALEQQLQAAYEAVTRQPQSAREIGAHVLAAADQLDVPLLGARAKHVLGLCFTTLGSFATAQTLLNTARATFTAAVQPVAAACCRRDEAIATYFAGDLGSARQALIEALSELEAQEQAVEASRCLYWLATLENFCQDTVKASAYLDQARRQLASASTPSDLATCDFVAGMIAVRRNQSTVALQAFNSAVQQFTQLGEDISLGRVLYEQGYAFMAQEDFTAAQIAAEQARELFQKHGVHHREGMVAELLGLLAMKTHHFAAAHQFLSAAQAAYQTAKMEVWTIQALLHRANLDCYLEVWADAEQAYHEVVRRATACQAQHLVLVAESNIGIIARNEGRYDAALAHAYTALDQAEMLGRRDDAARCHRLLADIYTALHDLPRADEHAGKALALLTELSTPLSLARAQTEYAEFCLQIGEFDRAIALLDAAQQSFIGQDMPVFMAHCDLLRAQAALICGEIAQAAALVEQSLAVYAAHSMPLTHARAQMIKAAIAVMEGDDRSASRLYQDAVQILSEALPTAAVDGAVALSQIAARNRDAAARLQWSQRAMHLLQQARSRVPTEHLAGAIVEQYKTLLRSTLYLALQQEANEVALSMAEDARAQVALAWIEGQRRHEPTTYATRELASRCLALRTKIDSLQQETETTPEAGAVRLQTLAQLQRDYDETFALRRRFGTTVIPGTPTRFDWEAWRAQINQLGTPWQTLVYWLEDNHLIAWHCTPTSIHCWQRRLSAQEQWALELCTQPTYSDRAYVYNRDPQTIFTEGAAATQLACLADLLLPPALSTTLTLDTLLIIVPSGKLHTLPFATLPLQGKPLVAYAAPLITPSLQLLQRLIQQPAARSKQALAIGVEEHRSRSILPHACVEAQLVSDVGVDIWCNASATAARLRAIDQSGQLQSYRLIHLATHTWTDQRTGLAAGIAFADQDLDMVEVAHLHLDADLVVLSGCESGIGKQYPGEELVGLTFGFFQAGARAVVTNFWLVVDHDALRFMELFYAARKSGRRGPWGLADAQRRAWSLSLKPYVWAGYVWIGKPAG